MAKPQKTPFEIIGRSNVKEYVLRALESYEIYTGPRDIRNKAAETLLSQMEFSKPHQLSDADNFVWDAFDEENIIPLLEEAVGEGLITKLGGGSELRYYPENIGRNLLVRDKLPAQK